MSCHLRTFRIQTDINAISRRSESDGRQMHLTCIQTPTDVNVTSQSSGLNRAWTSPGYGTNPTGRCRTHLEPDQTPTSRHGGHNIHETWTSALRNGSSTISVSSEGGRCGTYRIAAGYIKELIRYYSSHDAYAGVISCSDGLFAICLFYGILFICL